MAFADEQEVCLQKMDVLFMALPVKKVQGQNTKIIMNLMCLKYLCKNIYINNPVFLDECYTFRENFFFNVNV